MNSFVKIFQVTFLAPGNHYFMGLIKKKLSNRMNCNFSSFLYCANKYLRLKKRLERDSSSTKENYDFGVYFAEWQFQLDDS